MCRFELEARVPEGRVRGRGLMQTRREADRGGTAVTVLTGLGDQPTIL